MKFAVIIVLSILGVVALIEFCQAQDEGCDSFDCSMDCFSEGLHGECDSGECKCLYCIYNACRKYCNRLNRIAQCDEETCQCLS